jgi:retron-type reverse transcriptase
MIEEYVSYIEQFVKAHPKVKVQNLSSKINRLALGGIHRKMCANKAAGVDGVKKDEFSQKLDANLERLELRLKEDRYVPKPSKRVYIPKANGNPRPLGISSYEDKLVESNIAALVSAVYEPLFVAYSYGFRPKKDCHQAIAELRRQIMAEKVDYVVEADIKSFFDTLTQK